MVTLVLYGAVMLLAMTMAGLIGFAANVIALPLLSMFMPLELTVSMLVLFAALQSAVQAFRVRHEIHWRELAHILLFIIIGMPIGFFSLQYLPELALKGVLGIFVAFTAIKGLIENHRGKAKTTFHERPWHKLLLVCSGIISGAFGCGGPLTVIYTRNRYRDKQMFRVMQFGCGTFSMGLTCLAHVFAGSYTMARLPYMIVGLAAVLVALRLSTWLVQRMNTSFFQQLVNVVLLFSAASLLWQVVEGIMA